MNKPIIRWGILGCGKIARKFASDLQLVEGTSLAAVGARTRPQAEAFSQEYPAAQVHGSYLDLVNDPQVDIIYVATPHGLHYEHVLLCLEHGKAVLCEKAFALNSRQTRAMIAKAREKNLFLMEALWTKFLPHYQLTMAMIRDGRLGEVTSVISTFGFRAAQPYPDRLYDPALGGGSLLDIGIYNIFLTTAILGRPDQVEASMTPGPGGVDAQCSMVFSYTGGAKAHMLCSFLCQLPTEAWIGGTQGALHLSHRFYEPSTSVSYYPDKMDSRQLLPFLKEKGWGYRYQIAHVCDCLRGGLSESPIMAHTDTLALMELMDEVREKAGIHYPADDF